MANVKQSSSIRNTIYNGKHSLLPPKCPFPSISPSYADYVPSPSIGSKDIARTTREAISHHQRTSSESFLMEEQPSWFDELLNEPETPVRKGGHRRSSSDSCAYVDGANASVWDCLPQDEYRFKNMISVPSWGSKDFEYYKDVRHVSVGKPKNLARDSSFNSVPHPCGLPAKDHFIIESTGLSCVPLEADRFPSTATENLVSVESCPHESNVASEGRETSHGMPYTSETDTKRAKQQFAQRSRVRKLQYIAELERNVQVLQAEGSEVSAELEFVNQQNLILSMENKSLKQRLESLAQEQFIKYMEHEVLEREISRLRALYQQHQHQQQQPLNTHRRVKSTDLHAQFANLSLKQKDTGCECDDPLSGAIQN